jgi:hypothetical protein
LARVPTVLGEGHCEISRETRLRLPPVQVSFTLHRQGAPLWAPYAQLFKNSPFQNQSKGRQACVRSGLKALQPGKSTWSLRLWSLNSQCAAWSQPHAPANSQGPGVKSLNLEVSSGPEFHLSTLSTPELDSPPPSSTHTFPTAFLFLFVPRDQCFQKIFSVSS